MLARSIAVTAMDHKALGDAQAKLDHAAGRTVAKVTEKQVAESRGTIYALANYEEHPREAWFRQLAEPATKKELGEHHKKWLAHKQRGRPCETPWMEFVFTGASCADWDMPTANEWCDKAFAEFKRIHPEAKVLAATQHSAESSHHMHVFVEPWGRDERGKLRKGKTAMWRQGLSILEGRPQRKRFGLNESTLFGRLSQDAWEQTLGVPYGFDPRQPGRVKAKRNPKLDEIERRNAHSRELERVTQQRLAKANATVKRLKAERDAAVAERDAAVKANIEELASQNVGRRLLAPARLRVLEKRNAELEAEREAMAAEAAAMAKKTERLETELAVKTREERMLRQDLAILHLRLAPKRKPPPKTQMARMLEEEAAESWSDEQQAVREQALRKLAGLPAQDEAPERKDRQRRGIAAVRPGRSLGV